MLKLARKIGPALLALALVAGCGSDDGTRRPRRDRARRPRRHPPTTPRPLLRSATRTPTWSSGPTRSSSRPSRPWPTSSARPTASRSTVQAISDRPADQLRHRQRRRQRPRRGRRRPRLDRQPGAERRHRAAADLAPDDLSGYSEKAVEATTYDGQLYGVPYGIEAIALYRNTEVAPDEPKTFDDAVDAGLKAVKDGKVESALNLPVGDTGDPYHMEPILTSMGGYIFAYDEATGYDASDVGIGKEGSHRAAEKIAELAKEKVLRTSISRRQLDRALHRGQGGVPGLRPVGAARRAEGRLRVRHPADPRLRGRRPGRAVHGRPGVHGRLGRQERRVRAGVRQHRGQQRGGHADAVRPGQAACRP